MTTSAQEGRPMASSTEHPQPAGTPATGARRPSPRPRSNPAPSTDSVTDGNSEVGSSEFADASGTRETRNGEVESRNSEVTEREPLMEVVGRYVDRALAYVTPPSVLTDKPDSVAELARYAKAGGWTRSRTGFVRGCGIAWYRGVGLPYTVLSRYREWIAQRPGRAIPVLLLIKLLAATTPGVWAVEHLLIPAGRAAVWLFL